MSSKPKTKMISIRVTQEQFDYIEELAKRIRQSSGFKITRASIILKLMEFGKPLFEKNFPPQK